MKFWPSVPCCHWYVRLWCWRPRWRHFFLSEAFITEVRAEYRVCFSPSQLSLFSTKSRWFTWTDGQAFHQFINVCYSSFLQNLLFIYYYIWCLTFRKLSKKCSSFVENHRSSSIKGQLRLNKKDLWLWSVIKALQLELYVCSLFKKITFLQLLLTSHPLLRSSASQSKEQSSTFII